MATEGARGMTGEFEVAGVLIHPLLIAALLALPLAQLAGTGLARAGFYRLVWHRGLFDVALTIVFWAVLAALLTGTPLRSILFG